MADCTYLLTNLQLDGAHIRELGDENINSVQVCDKQTKPKKINAAYDSHA